MCEHSYLWISALLNIGMVIIFPYLFIIFQSMALKEREREREKKSLFSF